MAKNSIIKIVGILFLIFGVLSSPAALLAVLSAGNYKSAFGVVIDILARIIFISTPIGVMISAAGLLAHRRWARTGALVFSAIVSAVTLTYGITGLIDKAGSVFCTVCFVLGLIFMTVFVYLFKARDQFPV